MGNLDLVEELNGQIIEITEISMVDDEEKSKVYEDFKVEETKKELILRDLSKDNNIIHIRKDSLIEIEEDEEAGCIEMVCLNSIIRISTI